jgi:hypothetical protein
MIRVVKDEEEEQEGGNMPLLHKLCLHTIIKSFGNPSLSPH